MKLRLGFSTCPNDTFMFDAMVHGRVDTEGLSFELVLADIFHLNQMARREELDMVKVSYQTYGHLRSRYRLLDAGSALGRGCGPLLISKEPLTVQQLIDQQLPVAVPGFNTTAHLLLSHFSPQLQNKKEYIFHDIMPAILRGEAAAGVIIHENRFTYQQHGLQLIQDLGEHWEERTNKPIPLGAILARESLGEEIIGKLNRIMQRSVIHAFANPEEAMPFVRLHAQEMDDAVMKAHIGLYVNDFSVNLGEEGKDAVNTLLQVGESMGLFQS